MPRKNKKTRTPRLTRVHVEPVERDEIDWDRFAWALLQYCRIKIEAEDGDSE